MSEGSQMARTRSRAAGGACGCGVAVTGFGVEPGVAYQVVRPGYWMTSGSGVRIVRPWTMAWLTIMRSNGS